MTTTTMDCRDVSWPVAWCQGGVAVVPPPPSDNFLGALNFVIANVHEILYKLCKVQLVNKFNDSNNSGISIAIQLSNSFWE